MCSEIYKEIGKKSEYFHMFITFVQNESIKHRNATVCFPPHIFAFDALDMLSNIVNHDSWIQKHIS